MNKVKLLKKDGWISLYAVIIAFLMITFSLVLMNIYVSNLRTNKALKSNNYLDIEKNNIKNIVKGSMSKYLYDLKQDIIRKYPTDNKGSLFDKFEYTLLGNMNKNLDDIMRYRPILGNEFQNSNMEMTYKLHYSEYGSIKSNTYMGSLKFNIDIIINTKEDDIIEECVYDVVPNFDDRNAPVNVEIEKFQ
jgi:hypothetical protein